MQTAFVVLIIKIIKINFHCNFCDIERYLRMIVFLTFLMQNDHIHNLFVAKYLVSFSMPRNFLLNFKGSNSCEVFCYIIMQPEQTLSQDVINRMIITLQKKIDFNS